MKLNKNQIKNNMPTDFVGKDIHIFDELASTNQTAHEMAMKGAKEGTVIIAESQTKGRGRRGREWFSLANTNIYTSIILRPDIPPEKAPMLTLVAAVALAEAISGYLSGHLKDVSKIRPQIKWPNDILIDSKKCAGILTEMKIGGDGISYVIIGIGINVNMELSDIPHELKTIATSLLIEAGAKVSREAILQSLYSKIENWYKRYLLDGFLPIKLRWEELSAINGTFVRAASVTDGLHSYTEGEALGLGDEGELLLKKNDGSIIKVRTGDISVL